MPAFCILTNPYCFNLNYNCRCRGTALIQLEYTLVITDNYSRGKFNVHTKNDTVQTITVQQQTVCSLPALRAYHKTGCALVFTSKPCKEHRIRKSLVFVM